MLLTLENIALSYQDKVVLKKLNLSVARGEFVCLLGPSGCGKTSTLRVCAGLESPDEGRVIINGDVVTHNNCMVAPEKREIGFLFQDFALFPHLSVFDNVAFGLNKGLTKEQIRNRVHEVLEQVQMGDYAKSLPHMLSGGQQQRVALARAMAPKPQIILLDEPFSGLDSGLRGEIRDETLHVLKDHDIAGVMVTHDPEEAMFMGDRIVLMNDGQIVQEGRPTDLYAKPVNHFAASFFGDVNVIKGVFNDGIVKTVLGNVPATSFSNGQEVDVLVRPEDIQIQRIIHNESPTEKANILEARYLGRDSLLHISVEDDKGVKTHLHARVPGHLTPERDENVMATFEPESAFVFPAA